MSDFKKDLSDALALVRDIKAIKAKVDALQEPKAYDAEILELRELISSISKPKSHDIDSVVAQFDSARRTIGESVAVLGSQLSKRLDTIEDRLNKLDKGQADGE